MYRIIVVQSLNSTYSSLVAVVPQHSWNCLRRIHAQFMQFSSTPGAAANTTQWSDNKLPARLALSFDDMLDC